MDSCSPTFHVLPVNSCRETEVLNTNCGVSSAKAKVWQQDCHTQLTPLNTKLTTRQGKKGKRKTNIFFDGW